jgi:hypothetical protein
MNNSFFSFDDFKKWIEKQDPDEAQMEKKHYRYSGTTVESKVSVRKIVSKMEENEGDGYEVARDFFENGGVIVESEDKRFLIEVNSGSFYIHRMYVSKS